MKRGQSARMCFPTFSSSLYVSFMDQCPLGNLLAQIYGQQTNALDRAASNGTIAALMLRPVRITGQTGLPVWNSDIRRTIAREEPRQGRRA